MNEELYDQIYQIEQTHWWYVARRQIIFDWVFRVLAKYPAPRVLDIGCGTGYNIEYLHHAGHARVIGLDLSPKALAFCRSRSLTDLVCGDGAYPPFGPQTFDVVMALDLIEHIQDDQRALTELSRVLKPGGSLVIFTPAFQSLWGLQDEVSHHYRRYTAAELRVKVEAAGMIINKLTYANTLLFPAIWLGRRLYRASGKSQTISENDLHPSWSNGILRMIFAAERPLLHWVDLPFGVSLLCIAQKPNLQ